MQNAKASLPRLSLTGPIADASSLGIAPQYTQALWRSGDYRGLRRMFAPVKDQSPLFASMWAEASLALGEWRPAVWQAYESRGRDCVENMAATDKSERRYNAHCARWRGERLDGKRLFVAIDGGQGDLVMYLRYKDILESLGATVIWRAYDGLAPSLGLPGFSNELPPADYWVRMMSLPERLKTTLETVPPQWEGGERWQGGDSLGRIGYCLTGNPRHPHDRDRSIHGADPFHALTGWEAIPKDTDWRRTVQLMLTKRAIVTVDTSVAHMAASHYIPTFCLIAKGHDWRWLTVENGGLVRPSKWYESLTIVEQERQGSWREPIDKVLSILA